MCSKNGQHQFSPTNVTAQSLLKVMRIKNDHKRENAMIVYQLISTHVFKEMWENRSGKSLCGYWSLNDWKGVLLFRTLQIIVISMKITSSRRKSSSIVNDMKPKFEELNIIFGNKSTTGMGFSQYSISHKIRDNCLWWRSVRHYYNQ